MEWAGSGLGHHEGGVYDMSPGSGLGQGWVTILPGGRLIPSSNPVLHVTASGAVPSSGVLDGNLRHDQETYHIPPPLMSGVLDGNLRHEILKQYMALEVQSAQ